MKLTNHNMESKIYTVTITQSIEALGADEAKALLVDAIKHDNITSDQVEAEEEVNQ